MNLLQAYEALNTITRDSKKRITEAKRDPFHEAIFEAIDYLTEFNDIFPVPANLGGGTWEEFKDEINYGLTSDFEIAEIIMEYLEKDLAISKKHPEIFEEDPQSELTLETYNKLKRAFDRAVAKYKAEHPDDFKEAFRHDRLGKLESTRKSISENANKNGGFRTDGYRTALACYNSDDFDINVDLGMQNEDEYEVEDQAYLLKPGQTVADLVVYLSYECGFTNIYVYGQTSATREEIKTVTRFTTVPGNHDYADYGTIEDRLVEACTEDFDRVRAAAQCSRNCRDFYKALAANASEKELRPHAKAAAKFVKDNYGLTGDAAEDLLWSGYVVWKRLHEGCKKDRKPIPKGMTLKQLVEQMEQNEDTVECTWCEDLFDKSECRKEVNLGWLCSRCEAAIKSRGEQLTFIENAYWDFLDRDSLDESTAVADSKLVGKYVQLVNDIAKYGAIGSPWTLARLKDVLRANKNNRLRDMEINLIAKFDNKCKVIQETEAGCLVRVPCYYRNRQDRSKFEESPRLVNCWVPKAQTKLIEADEA